MSFDPPPTHPSSATIGRRLCRPVCLQAVSLSTKLPPRWSISSPFDPCSNTSSLQSGPSHLQPAGGRKRRPPSTPPLPLRTLQLVAKQPETTVVLRDRMKPKGQVSGVRESWPGAGPMTFEPKSKKSQRMPAPPALAGPIAEALSKDSIQPHPHVNVAALFPAALHPHCSGSSLIAIDNKIEAAMDLVKSHLMLAVREEVELLREQIRELQEKNQQLERENQILRTLTHNLHSTHNP
uniref:Uncharacterized protein n=1 Tax=Gasterosteus aculeatus aculeatus TaxID=481459 RepID=A0AAQ4QU24_GASAC